MTPTSGTPLALPASFILVPGPGGGVPAPGFGEKSGDDPVSPLPVVKRPLNQQEWGEQFRAFSALLARQCAGDFTRSAETGKNQGWVAFRAATPDPGQFGPMAVDGVDWRPNTGYSLKSVDAMCDVIRAQLKPIRGFDSVAVVANQVMLQFAEHDSLLASAPLLDDLRKKRMLEQVFEKAREKVPTFKVMSVSGYLTTAGA